MGYDLHITRRDDWSDRDGLAITSDEWLQIVEIDPALRLDHLNGLYFALLGDEAWLDWSDGQIFTKNPDQPTLQKMLEIADRLGARVQGDDGEFYDSTSQLDAGTYKTKEAWIEFLRGAIFPTAVLMLVSVLVFAICYLLFLRD